MMKVLLCIPFTGDVPAMAAYSLIPMVCHARKNGIEVSMLPIGMSLVYAARESAVNATLQDKEFDALMFIDSDMVVPMDMLTRLVQADKPIVSALAFKRFDPYEPCIFKELSETDAKFYFNYPKGLIEIAGVGMACTLIRRDVLENIPAPWFYPRDILGEDLEFCLRAKKAGYSIWCDTTLICGHMSNVIIMEEHYVNRMSLGQK